MSESSSSSPFVPAAPYRLLDSGGGEKLEMVGEFRLVRPCPQAFWPRRLAEGEWAAADAVYERSTSGGGDWQYRRSLPATWHAAVHGQPWLIKPTGFGHLGIFPEQETNWGWLQQQARRLGKGARCLNLFAYTGGSTLALAHAGAQVAHVDAARGVVSWGRDNAKLQGVEAAPVQWLVEDALKFCQREVRRGRRYQGIVLDPPTFGRGPSGEMWKIETDVQPLLQVVRDLLEPGAPGFVLLSCHSPGFSGLVLENLLAALVGKPAEMDSAEMTIPESGQAARVLPSGCSARWTV